MARELNYELDANGVRLTTPAGNFAGWIEQRSNTWIIHLARNLGDSGSAYTPKGTYRSLEAAKYRALAEHIEMHGIKGE